MRHARRTITYGVTLLVVWNKGGVVDLDDSVTRIVHVCQLVCSRVRLVDIRDVACNAIPIRTTFQQRRLWLETRTVGQVIVVSVELPAREEA